MAEIPTTPEYVAAAAAATTALPPYAQCKTIALRTTCQLARFRRANKGSERKDERRRRRDGRVRGDSSSSATLPRGHEHVQQPLPVERWRLSLETRTTAKTQSPEGLTNVDNSDPPRCWTRLRRCPSSSEHRFRPTTNSPSVSSVAESLEAAELVTTTRSKGQMRG